MLSLILFTCGNIISVKFEHINPVTSFYLFDSLCIVYDNY
jgi:hypothetical protein